MGVALHGNLKDFGIAEVFQLIGQQRKTGLLEITNQKQKVQLAFDEGAVVWATPVGNSEFAVLGDRLVRCGLIPRPRLDELIAESEASARQLPSLLVSSGAVQETLGDERRTVITGTRSGEQRNATVFAAYFTAALERETADVDKDERITALEAFQYAEAGVGRHYAGEGEMATEHPQSMGPESSLVLAVLETQVEADPALAHLYSRRDTLEAEIAILREDKATYDPDDYFAELQRLLLELAMVAGQLEEAEAQP